MSTIFFQGVLMGGSLIIAIGLQNAFILRQGLLKRHIFVSALTASLCDVLLISLGVLGFGKIISAVPLLENIMIIGAIIFLILYGLKSFKSAYKLQALEQSDAKGLAGQGSVTETIVAIMAISLLNPHAILDTVVLLGSISTAYPAPHHLVFGAGAVSASFLWFFSLAYGAGFLNGLFSKPKAWQILDVIIGFIMWMIAIGLIMHFS